MSDCPPPTNSGEVPPPLPPKRRSSNRMPFDALCAVATQMRDRHEAERRMSSTGKKLVHQDTMTERKNYFLSPGSNRANMARKSADDVISMKKKSLEPPNSPSKCSHSGEGIHFHTLKCHPRLKGGEIGPSGHDEFMTQPRRKASYAKGPPVPPRVDSMTRDLMGLAMRKDGDPTTETLTTDEPPELPAKLRSKGNISNLSPGSSYPSPNPVISISGDSDKDIDLIYPRWNDKNHSFSCPQQLFSHFGNDDPGKPPPLPPKKRHVEMYVQSMMAGYRGPNEPVFNMYRRSVHAHHGQTRGHHHHQHHPRLNTLRQVDAISFLQQQRSLDSGLEFAESNLSFSSTSKSSSSSPSSLPQLPPSETTTKPSPPSPPSSSLPPPPPDVVLSAQREPSSSSVNQPPATTLLNEVDVDSYLVLRVGSADDGPEIKGGHPDALLVKATEVTKKDFLFQEAFIATYRTFVSPDDLIDKLLYRYDYFSSRSDGRKSSKIALNAFALLVRVVDDLCLSEWTPELSDVVMRFVQQLTSSGDLALAKLLKTKFEEKVEAKKAALELQPVLLPSVAISTKVSSILDYKAHVLAEQMTLVDSELFSKVEVAEALFWAKEQKEEVIPNLTKFTEHFNNVSFWIRTKILREEEAKDREKVAVKLIKVMKSLRRLSNFNSIFAILSALDSAPVRRLDWPRPVTDGMKEYSPLIDSSSSFRTYRQALAETDPPCIPYIGLILQDLTFVHVGNDDFLPDGNVNFGKRWLQFNMLDQMRRYRNSHYPFTKNDEVINMFGNFQDYLDEDSLWQISESIKARPKK